MKPVITRESGNLCLVARFLEATGAHVLQARLEAEGIQVVLADDQLIQANPLIAVAIGGVRVLVASSQLERAREVIAAVERGEYAIDEDFDVGPLDS